MGTQSQRRLERRDGEVGLALHPVRVAEIRPHHRIFAPRILRGGLGEDVQRVIDASVAFEENRERGFRVVPSSVAPSRPVGFSLAGASSTPVDDDAGAGEFASPASSPPGPRVCRAVSVTLRLAALYSSSRIGPIAVQLCHCPGSSTLSLGTGSGRPGCLDWRDHLGHGALLDLLLGQPVDRSGFGVETEARRRVRHARGPQRPRREASRRDVSRAIRDSRRVMAVTVVPAGAGCDGSRLGHARDAAAVAGGRSPRVALSSATGAPPPRSSSSQDPPLPYGSRIFGTSHNLNKTENCFPDRDPNPPPLAGSPTNPPRKLCKIGKDSLAQASRRESSVINPYLTVCD